jgi:hypothetical protein
MPRPVSSMETTKAYPSPACILICGVEATSQGVVLDSVGIPETRNKPISETNGDRYSSGLSYKLTR